MDWRRRRNDSSIDTYWYFCSGPNWWRDVRDHRGDGRACGILLVAASARGGVHLRPRHSLVGPADYGICSIFDGSKEESMSVTELMFQMPRRLHRVLHPA